MKSIIQKYLDKGTSYASNHEDRRRVREVNGLTYSGLLLIIPAVIIRNVLVNDWNEIYLFGGYIAIILFTIILNHVGQNQFASKLILVSSIFLTAIAVYINDVQIGAPFLNIVIAISGLHLIKSKWQSYLVLSLSFIVFSISMWYQSVYLPFDLDEFKLSVLVIGLLFAMMIVSRKEVARMQEEIIRQSETIQKQSQEMLKLKQKDLESLSGNIGVVKQYTTKLKIDLRKALEGKALENDIRSILIQMESEEETHSKLELMTDNFDQINAEFHQRLLDRFPGLSAKEKELASYLKINLSNREISTLKNTTENAITVAKTRLRKKLRFDSNKELINFLSQL